MVPCEPIANTLKSVLAFIVPLVGRYVNVT